MDYRLALLLETHHGLRLEADDLTRLLRLDDAECADHLTTLDAVHGLFAREHLSDGRWLGRAEETLAISRRRGVRWTYLGRSDYPDAWYEISCRPILFCYRGTPAWLSHPMIAVVGSRTPTLDTCRWMEREFSKYLDVVRVGVVSGGARGVDQLAHRMALGAGRPTVCILPSGVLEPYPPGQEGLWEEFIDGGGCVLSTFPIGGGMRKQNFAIRNRWIAGLSPVVFVVEANHRSGSHLTAQLAVQEQRDICTLPVSANASQGLANLQFIYDGHQMIRDAEDLRVLTERKILRPGPSVGVHRDPEEEQIDEPQGDVGG